MMRVSGYFWSVSLQTYQLRASVPGRLRRARLNQGCWSEVWLMTSSVMTRRPRRLRLRHEAAEVAHRAEVGIDAAVVGDVVAVVAAGARIERQQPERGDAEVLQVVELLGQPGEIADAVVVAVGERLDVKLIDDRVLVPEVVLGLRLRRRFAAATFTVELVSGFAAEQQRRVVGRIDASGARRPIRACAARR